MFWGFTIYSGTHGDAGGWLATYPVAAVAFFVLTAAACFLFETMAQPATECRSILEYQDPGDPVVRTLELRRRRWEEQCSRSEGSPSSTATRPWWMT